jgi:hypothetical protein
MNSLTSLDAGQALATRSFLDRLSRLFKYTFLLILWTVVVLFSAILCWAAYKSGQQSLALSCWQFFGALTQDVFVSIWFRRPRYRDGEIDLLRLDAGRRCGWLARIMGVVGPAYSAYSLIDLVLRIPKIDFAAQPHLTIPAVSVGVMLSAVDFLTAWQVWMIIRGGHRARH